MIISNLEKSQISYWHKDKIQRLFRTYVHGNLGIDHFSLNIFFGDGENVFLSPTPEMAEDLCKNDFINQDSNYSPEIYTKLSLYPWRAVQRHETDRIINFVKEEKFHMRSGMMIVRNLGQGRYAMYSVATHRRDHPDFSGQFCFLFHCKANYIAKMGDFLYNSLLSTINEYSVESGVEMPKITTFTPIMLDQSFSLPSQRELFETINNSNKKPVETVIQNTKKPILRLVQGGKVEHWD